MKSYRLSFDFPLLSPDKTQFKGDDGKVFILGLELAKVLCSLNSKEIEKVFKHSRWAEELCSQCSDKVGTFLTLDEGDFAYLKKVILETTNVADYCKFQLLQIMDKAEKENQDSNGKEAAANG